MGDGGASDAADEEAGDVVAVESEVALVPVDGSEDTAKSVPVVTVTWLVPIVGPFSITTMPESDAATRSAADSFAAVA